MLRLFEGELGARQTQRFIEEMLHAGYWTWELGSTEMQWSEGLYKLFGLEPGTTKPSCTEFESTIHREDRGVLAEVERVLHRLIAVTRDFRIVTPSGRVRWISMNAEPVATDTAQRVRAVGLCRDDTRHREDALLLETKEQRLHGVARLATTLSWVARPDGSLIEFMGMRDNLRSVDAKLPADWTRLVHPEDHDRFVSAWRTAIETRKPLSVEHMLRAPSGSWFPCLSRAIPTVDQAGGIIEWVGISWDIADICGLQQQPRSALTGAQIRAARAILSWSVDRLSHQSGVRPGTIRRIEEVSGAPTGDENELAALEKTLNEAGIEFTNFYGGKPGVRPR